MGLGEILKTLVTSMGPLGWSWFPPPVALGHGYPLFAYASLPAKVRKGKDDRRLNEDPYLTSEANYPDDGHETSLRDLDG